MDLPEDHISFIFAFIALLCDRARTCLENRDVAGAARLIEQQRDFARAHVLSWVDAFCDLAREIVKTRFYRGVLEATCTFAWGDAELAEADLADVRNLA